MTFDILQYLDQLEPDGGTNHPRGDHSMELYKMLPHPASSR